MHILKITAGEKKKNRSIKSEPDQCYQKSKLTAGSPASHYLGCGKGQCSVHFFPIHFQSYSLGTFQEYYHSDK